MANGEKPCEQESLLTYKENEYWNSSLKNLKQEIEQYDSISFDIFDTLIMRKIFLPRDAFLLIERRIRADLNLNFDFAIMRQNVVATSEYEKNIVQIYHEMQNLTGLQWDTMQKIMNIEIEV